MVVGERCHQEADRADNVRGPALRDPEEFAAVGGMDYRPPRRVEGLR